MSDPIPLLIWCPMCKERHIDRGEYATKPHHTHACQGCGLTWRPAVVPTVGVEFLPGFKDGAEVPPQERAPMTIHINGTVSNPEEIAAEVKRALAEGRTPTTPAAPSPIGLNAITAKLRAALPDYRARGYTPSFTDVITDIAPTVLEMIGAAPWRPEGEK